jgi:hypothetical protein
MRVAIYCRVSTKERISLCEASTARPTTGWLGPLANADGGMDEHYPLDANEERLAAVERHKLPTRSRKAGSC